MNSETTLLRQVHPHFIQEGQLSSQAFIPFPRDDGKVSVYDGDQISADESYRHFTETLGNKSDSVWGVVCSEVSSIGLSSVPDPQIDFPSHSLIDFTVHPQKEFRKLAKKLRQFAISRGCLYPSR
jgi:hypothetical protein